jgi:translation initiation factor IF-1
MEDVDELEGTELVGTVLEILPRALYRVNLGGGREVVAHPRTGPGKNFVRLIVGDKVAVVVSRRDVTRGRIVGKR